MLPQYSLQRGSGSLFQLNAAVTNPTIGMYMVHVYHIISCNMSPLSEGRSTVEPFQIYAARTPGLVCTSLGKVADLENLKEACIERDKSEKTAAESPWYNRITPNVEKAKPFQPLASQEGLINS